MNHVRRLLILLAAVAGLLVASCNSSHFVPGTFSFDRAKAQFPAQQLSDSAFTVTFAQDGTFGMRPFELHGQWKESGDKLTVTVSNPNGVVNYVEGRSWGCKEPLQMDWEIVGRDDVVWRFRGSSGKSSASAFFTRVPK